MNYGDEPYIPGLHPFIDYIYEDKSKYESAASKGYSDDDGDFLIGDSGGFLLNWNFIFINTEEFSEVAATFRATKQYCSFIPNTTEYNDFWRRETKRRREGMTLNCKLYHKDVDTYFNPTTPEYIKKSLLHPLRITGDHYNYLNYSRINRTPTEEEKIELVKSKSKKKKIKEFPQFWDGDYWNFKIDEFIANNNFHLCKAKARRKGYSYKRGSQAANTINLNKDLIIALGAFDITYLTKQGGTSTMLKTNLDWYENYTYWHRGYVKEDLREITLGYKTSTGGNKIYGWNSTAISETLFNNPNAFIGKDATEIDIEEAGRCPNLQEVVNVTLSAMEAGDELTGTMRVYGTGGAKGADWEPFKTMFYNPILNQMLPLENVWDANSRYDVCGFFHPQILNYYPHMDKHGNSFIIRAFYIDAERKNRAKDKLTPHDYAIFCGQRANSPSEAFLIGETNIFTSPALTEHYTALETQKNRIRYRDGMVFKREGKVVFLTNEEMESEGLKTHPFINNVPIGKTDDPKGCVRMWYPPVIIGGEKPKNLHVVVIDPMGKDIDEKELTIRHSLVSIQIWRLPNLISNHIGDLLCCTYTGRPDLLEEGSDIAMMLTELYGGECLPETDRGTVVADFKKAGNKNLLARDPFRILKDENMFNIPFGLNIGGGDKSEDLTIALKDLLYTPVAVREDGTTIYTLHYIQDIAFIKELLKYKKKGNFDRISAARLYVAYRIAFKYKKRTAQPSMVNAKTLLSQLGFYK